MDVASGLRGEAMNHRKQGERIRGHGTAPGGYPAQYVEDDTGKHYEEPEDVGPNPWADPWMAANIGLKYGNGDSYSHE